MGAGFAALRALGPDRASALGGAVMRAIGPLLPSHRVGARNLRLAMPELDARARARILCEAWDNLGRMSCEYVHADRIAEFDRAMTGPQRIETGASDQFIALRDDGKPALFFTAHLANWEVPAIMAHRYGMDSAVLYRTPNNPYVARRIRRLRAGLMGQLVRAGRTAPPELAAALARGAHVGMLVDQRFGRGPHIPFFGRPAATNTLLARLARHYDCPVHGVRAIRLDGVRFRLELTPAMELPRDAEGLIDVVGATAAITAVVEGWVREHPGQWLWMHRRWRM